VEFLRNLFERPVQDFSRFPQLAMLVPLALAISVVYKTIRCEKLSRVPLASATLTVMILGSMLAIGVVLLVVFNALA
jgi:hypothetical protein